MYNDFFNFNANPFKPAPDPNCFYESPWHSQAVEKIHHAVTERAGLVLVLGDIGTGKTTICRYIQQKFQSEYLIGYVGNPFVSPEEFGEQILEEFSIRGEGKASQDVIRSMKDFLQKCHADGKPVVIFIDEAHLLAPAVLDMILILTNLQTAGIHYLQVILSGQLEFEDTLRLKRFSSLNQRLGNRVVLDKLDRNNTLLYIDHRLRAAGSSWGRVFTKGAMPLIWRITGGTPRLVNQVCDQLLTRAAANRSGTITTLNVLALLKDKTFRPLLVPRLGRTIKRTALALGILAVVVFGAANRDALFRQNEHKEVTAAATAPAVSPVSTPATASSPPARPSEPMLASKLVASAPPEHVAPAPPRPSTPSSATGDHLSPRPASSSDAGARQHIAASPKVSSLMPPSAAGKTIQQKNTSVHTPKLQVQRTPGKKVESAMPPPPENLDASAVAVSPVLSFPPAPSSAASASVVSNKRISVAAPALAAKSTHSHHSAASTPSNSLPPTVQVEAIAWDKDPGERVALINGELIKEGIEINGYRMERIFKDRVEMSKQGKHYSGRLNYKE